MGKKWFESGDIAHMSRKKGAKTFTLQIEQPVKIINSVRIEDKAGSYMYTIEAENPKNGEKVVLEEWVTQKDLYDKDFWAKLEAGEKKLKELEQKKKNRK